MPGLAVDSGVGLTVTFGTSGFTAELEDFRWTGITRTAIPTSHLGTTAPGANQFGNKTYMPARLSDPGQLQLQMHFNPQTNLPIDAVAEVITITYPKPPADSTAASWSASGFVTDIEIGEQMEAANMINVTVKLSGKVSMTDGT